MAVYMGLPAAQGQQDIMEQPVRLALPRVLQARLAPLEVAAVEQVIRALLATWELLGILVSLDIQALEERQVILVILAILVLQAIQV
jgi:hypothetical protein